MPDTFEQPDLVVRSASGFGRAYRHPHTGVEVPSVTTISGALDKSGFLAKWAEKIAIETAVERRELFRSTMGDAELAAAVKTASEAKRTAGRDLGSHVHNTIEAMLKGRATLAEIEQSDPRLVHHVRGFAEWLGRYVARVLEIEATVWSHTHGYAGTLDLLVQLRDGRTALVDIKAGKDVREDAALQLAGLRFADCIVSTDGERPLPRVDVTGVLHLPAPVTTATGRVSVRGQWSFREIEESGVGEDWRCFLALREAKRWESSRKRTCLGGKATMPAPRPAVAFDPARQPVAS